MLHFYLVFKLSMYNCQTAAEYHKQNEDVSLLPPCALDLPDGKGPRRESPNLFPVKYQYMHESIMFINTSEFFLDSTV